MSGLGYKTELLNKKLLIEPFKTKQNCIEVLLSRLNYFNFNSVGIYTPFFNLNRHNEIQTLPTDIFENMPSLEILIVESNKLMTLSEGTFKPVWKQLRHFDAMGEFYLFSRFRIVSKTS